MTHKVLADYIQDTAISTGVHEVTQYDTNVESVSKKGESWSVETTTFQTDATGTVRWKKYTQVFAFITTKQSF